MIELIIERWGSLDGSSHYLWSVWQDGKRIEMSGRIAGAQSAEALGLHLRSLRAEAESHAALGDLSGAIDRLRSAQRQAREARIAPDFIEASIIDSRLRDLSAQRRAQLAEARGERGRQEPAQ